MELNVSWIAPVENRDYNRMPASVWIRCLQLFPYLEEMGVGSTFNDPTAGAPIAVFVRFQNDEAYQQAERLKEQGRRIVFDLCVNYFDLSEVRHLGVPVSSRHVDECLRMASLADVITCASENIAERARQHHRWVECLPDSIDRRHFSLVKDREDFKRRKLRAIWSGQSVKLCELAPVLPLLKERDIRLTVITNSRPDLRVPGRFRRRRFPCRYLPWSYETFPGDILKGEICITHREIDTAYNRGHSFFKIGVFMAQGVPAIASPVPSYRELLDDRSCGRICQSLEQWGHALDEVLAERELLVQWSERARKLMEAYSTGQMARRYLKLFKRLAE